MDENLKLIKINCSSKKHEEMRKVFAQYGKRSPDFNCKREHAEKAEENIRKIFDQYEKQNRIPNWAERRY